MALLITTVVLLAILDTWRGNRIFPGRVRIVTDGKVYWVSKVHRLFFIPFIMWQKYSGKDRQIDDFVFSRHNAKTTEYLKKAQEYARIWTGEASKTRRKETQELLSTQHVVWDSRRQAVQKQNNDTILELVPLLVKAVNENDTDKELQLIEQIKKLS
jgi:hypothetical protein